MRRPAYASNTLNLCELPPWVIASREFNEDPKPLELQGLRRSNRFLFEKLEAINDRAERASVFNDYMSVKFYLHQWEEQATPKARRSIKNSYLRFLRGWGADSNSVEGAVLKGWVESRIGLPPTFHKEKIADPTGDSAMQYMVDRMKGSALTNAINDQLDLLYAYTQYELARDSDARWLTLYRGTYDVGEHELLETLDKRQSVVRLNNLSSFTGECERAWEFGSTVWEARVPVVKIFYFGDLLPASILKGEKEYLVIGGEYRVKRVMA